MKHLPLKLGIFVVLLFAAVITACLLWTPVKIRYYVWKFRSNNDKECCTGVKGLFALGNKGKKELTSQVRKDFDISSDRRFAFVVNVLLSLSPDYNELLAENLNGGEDELDFLITYRVNADYPWDNSFEELYSLHNSARLGCLDVARLLISEGNDVNGRDKEYWTPLHYAARTGMKDMAKFLIERGADVNAADRYSGTPLELAASQGHLETAILLINRGANVSLCRALTDAAEFDHLKIVKLLLAKGAVVNPKVMFRGPLHAAAQKGNLDIIKFLISKGAEVDLKGEYNRTPLHFAARSSQPHCAEFLLEKGADVNFVEENGYLPLHWAAQEGDLNTLKLLIAGGSIINLPNDYGETPLDLSVTFKHKQVEDLLRAHGGRTGKEIREQENKRKRKN